MAVFFVGEVFAGIAERGTAAVETIGVVNLVATGLKGRMLMRGPGEV